ncbi:MAG: hypothetical protein KY476_13220, partial [Planctomycetes bacterium]|nr:hypothetical protein [Planctomycetota bacterium]
MSLDRREFLAAAAGVAVAGTAARASSSPNEKVGVAVLGCGRGGSLAHWFSRIDASQVVAICDPDASRGNRLCEQIAEVSGRRPPYVVDFRTLLEKGDV